MSDRKPGKVPELGYRFSGMEIVGDVYAAITAKKEFTGVIKLSNDPDDIFGDTPVADTLVPGEPTRGLTFKALRSANTARCPLFKNAKGETQHSGRDWSPNDWMVSTFGELGEAANVMKKVRRGDFTMHEARPKLAQEFADTIIYLDMLAAECGINLSEAIMETFNAKSAQLELPLFITEDGYVVETRK